MYLEISSRRSGKTTRMARHLVSQVDGGDILVVTPSMAVIDPLKHYMSDCGCDGKNVVFASQLRDTIGRNFSRIYIEEFDYISNDVLNQWVTFCKEQVSISNSHLYFVTTPSKLRTMEELVEAKDAFSTILQMNEYRYVSCLFRGTWPHTRNLEEEFYRTEVLGQFVKYEEKEKEDVVEMISRGEILLKNILPALNNTKIRSAEAYRRKEDVEELCLALALYEKQRGEK